MNHLAHNAYDEGSDRIVRMRFMQITEDKSACCANSG